MRIGYFWMRLIMTIGWAIYPILYFVDVVIGVGHVAPVVALLYDRRSRQSHSSIADSARRFRE